MDDRWERFQPRGPGSTRSGRLRITPQPDAGREQYYARLERVAARVLKPMELDLYLAHCLPPQEFIRDLADAYRLPRRRIYRIIENAREKVKRAMPRVMQEEATRFDGQMRMMADREHCPLCGFVFQNPGNLLPCYHSNEAGFPNCQRRWEPYPK